MSSFLNPSFRASLLTVLIMSIFSSRLSGSPLSESGSKMNIAPYFCAIFKSGSLLWLSFDIELINALPGYFLSAASIMSTCDESIHNGNWVTVDSSSMVLNMSSFSSTPLIPRFTSSKEAPLASCSVANSSAFSIFPSKSCA